jgi:hypothetical protein
VLEPGCYFHHPRGLTRFALSGRIRRTRPATAVLPTCVPQNPEIALANLGTASPRCAPSRPFNAYKASSNQPFALLSQLTASTTTDDG